MVEGKKQAGKEKAKSKEAKERPPWLKFSEREVEAIILKLAKQNLSSEKIGLVLRDEYGIPKTKLFGKSIGKILKEHEIYKDADMINLEKKREGITKHFETNKQDKKAKRALTITIARVSKHKKYKRRDK